MTDRNGSSRPLTRLQQGILDVLWSRGPASAEEIREALDARHPLKDSSVRTLLRRLEARGYVVHHVVGKTFIYRAVAPRRRVAARAVRELIDRFWAGSVEDFLVGMVDEKVLSRREIERLSRIVRRKG